MSARKNKLLSTAIKQGIEAARNPPKDAEGEVQMRAMPSDRVEEEKNSLLEASAAPVR